MIDFFLPMKKLPTVTHQQKKIRVVNGKPNFYEGHDLKRARDLFTSLLIKHQPQHPIVDKPIKLTTMWMYQTNDKSKQGTFKLSRPDTDNAIKLLKDCMSDIGFWKDDALVVVDEIHKYWAEENRSGIYVRIEILEE